MKFAFWTSGLGVSEEVIKFVQNQLNIEYLLIIDNDQLIKELNGKMDVVGDENKALEKYNVDYVILLNYPHIIPKEYLVKQKFLNIHNSLLPKYRGRHAFTWAMINGEDKVGYTIFEVDGGIDTGDILFQTEISLQDIEDINDLFYRAGELLPKWILSCLLNISSGNYFKIKQLESESSYYQKRLLKDNLINWQKEANDVVNFIKALKPPYTKGAFFRYKDNTIFIDEAKVIEYKTSEMTKVGEIIKADDKELLIRCLNAAIKLEKVIINNTSVDSSFQNYFKERDRVE